MRSLQASDPAEIGPYRPLAELGRGGMGRVLLAAGADGRLVALKLVRDQITDQDGFRDRFRREVEASRRVSGAYTAAVVDADPDAPTPWLASAFVPGPTLAEALAATGPLPEEAVLRLAAGLAAALRSIHDAGLVHRDLKPSNVLLAEDGPRVIDFGIARATDSPGGATLADTGRLVGAPAYMSPEHAEGSADTPASDVFALGCVLAAACTGTDLFTGTTALQVLYQVVHAEPDLSGLPERLRELIAPCLAKDPSQRPTPARLLELIGTVPPAATPWPAGVHRLIAAQNAELALLLDSPGGAQPTETIIAPGPPASVPARSSPLRLVLLIAAGCAVMVLGGTCLVGVGLLVTRQAHHGASGSAGTTSAAPPTGGATASAPATAQAGQTGEVHANNGNCLDVYWGGGSTDADGTPVQVHACNGGTNQQWTAESDGTLRALGKCLDVAGGVTATGTKVQLYTCNGTVAQLWTADAGQLVNTGSGKCLDDPAQALDDTQLQIWDCVGDSNQQWQLP